MTRGGGTGDRPGTGAATGAETTRHAERGADVLRIDDRGLMQHVVDTVVFGAASELCSMLPAGPYPLAVMRSSRDSDVALLRRGVRIAAIYQAESARSPDMLRYLAGFVAAGAQVRSPAG